MTCNAAVAARRAAQAALLRAKPSDQEFDRHLLVDESDDEPVDIHRLLGECFARELQDRS